MDNFNLDEIVNQYDYLKLRVLYWHFTIENQQLVQKTLHDSLEYFCPLDQGQKGIYIFTLTHIHQGKQTKVKNKVLDIFRSKVGVWFN